jgi:hypothetical protein
MMWVSLWITTKCHAEMEESEKRVKSPKSGETSQSDIRVNDIDLERVEYFIRPDLSSEIAQYLRKRNAPPWRFVRTHSCL